jgi:hypothetical protein
VRLPAHLSAEVGLLDSMTGPPPAPTETGRGERAKKGQRAPKRDQRPAKVVEFPKGIGSPSGRFSQLAAQDRIALHDVASGSRPAASPAEPTETGQPATPKSCARANLTPLRATRGAACPSNSLPQIGTSTDTRIRSVQQSPAA